MNLYHRTFVAAAIIRDGFRGSGAWPPLFETQCGAVAPVRLYGRGATLIGGTGLRGETRGRCGLGV